MPGSLLHFQDTKARLIIWINFGCIEASNFDLMFENLVRKQKTRTSQLQVAKPVKSIRKNSDE